MRESSGETQVEIQEQLGVIESRHSQIIERMLQEPIEVEPYIGEFPGYVKEDEQLLNLEDLRRKYGEQWGEISSVMDDYFKRPGGKRLRPLLLVNGYEMFSDKKYDEKVLDAAVGLEIIHEMALALDDVMDDSQTRRGAPSLWVALTECVEGDEGQKVEKAKQLTLELMPMVFSWSRKLMVDDADESVKPELSDIFWKTNNDVKKAQQRDLESAHSGRWPSMDEALKNAYLKAGRYSIRLPLFYALMLSGRGQEENLQNAIEEFSQGFGLAFQLHDDLLILEPEEKIGKDSRQDAYNGSKIPLVIVAREKASSSDREFIEKTWGNPSELSPVAIQQLVSIFKQSGALAENISLIRQNIKLANKGLNQITNLGYDVRRLRYILDKGLPWMDDLERRIDE
jgi:geranylgeranyl diphosphate synthase type I